MLCEICHASDENPPDMVFWDCADCSNALHYACEYFADTTGDSTWLKGGWWRSINESDVAPFNAFMAGAGLTYRAEKIGSNFAVIRKAGINPARYVNHPL